MKRIPRWLLDLLISLPCALILGAVTAAFSAGTFWQGWWSAGSISWVAIFLLLQVWRRMDSSKALGILILVTFLVRIAAGIFIYKVLPFAGYDTPVQSAGFFYADAQARDQAAFQLAGSQDSLLKPFIHPIDADQYGGLLFMSAAIYRFLSPEAARPLLITLLAAFAMAAGVGFLYQAIKKRWSSRMALTAGWIFALFPDSVLLGSSQMREPFLISLACIGFWAVLQWREKPLKTVIIALLAAATACAFSLPAGAVIAFILAAIFLLDWSLAQNRKAWRLAGLAALVLLACAAVVAGWMWLKNTLYYDAYTTKISSGWITALIDKYGEKWNIPFVTLYGLTQPLLPAAIFEPSLPFWVTIAILRALGWYLVLPLLLFGTFACWKAGKDQNKWILVMLSLVFLAWTVVSSGRAGGDQWDNPRYRYILMPFMALILAWAIERYRETHSPWLWRWVTVVAVFLLFFTNFYANRYILGIGTQLPFLLTIALIVIINAVFLVSCVIWDKIHARKRENHG